MRRRVPPPSIDSLFAYTNYKNFFEHTGLSRNKRKYYRRQGYIREFYMPVFNYKKQEFIRYQRVFAFDHTKIRKYEKGILSLNQ